MLAESEGPKPIGSEALWKSSIIVNNTKHPVTQHQHKRRAPIQRSCFLGLETKPELLWEDWDEGGEFTKSLTLKNIGLKLQKLQLRPPVTKFFSISSSRNVAVSPGTTLSIPVTFKPEEKCKYEDSIEFQGKDGSFQVSLQAVVPYPALEVPDTVLLPLCAVHQTASAPFLLKNLSKLHTYFHWECSEPFQVSPEEGVLKPSQEIQLTVVFQPQLALLYNKLAACRFGEEGEKADCCVAVRLQGVAKYPCLHLRSPSSKADQQHGVPVLNFGSVAVGQSVQKCFDICNPSHVTAFFSLARLSGGVPLLGCQFVCEVSSNRVAPGGSITAKVTFVPTVADSVSVEYLTVECKGALNQTVLKLIGNSTGPKLSFSSSLVDFGCIELGTTASQTIEMINSSCVQATYQWDLDCAGHSVFSIQPQSGTLAAKSCLTLTVCYLPTVPFAHHRSVPCFVLHGAPLFLDLIGTCHSDLEKPAVLTPEHLADSPEDRSDIISVLLPSNSTQLDPQAFGLSADEKASRQSDNTSIARSMTPKEDADRPGSAEADSSALSSPSTRVSAVPSELLFNHVTSPWPRSTSSAASQGVAITNNSAVKVTLMWTNAPDSPFSVSPSTRELSPLKCTSFRVTYSPKEVNTFHAAQLECLALQQSPSWKNEEQISPPWCVIVRVIGHSFERGKEHFHPHFSLEPNKVVFTGLDVRSYQTLLLRNNCERPLTFCRNLNESFDPPLEASVSVVPRCGLIPPGAHQILTVITTPKEDSPTEGIELRLQFNCSNYTKEITVFSILEKMNVSLSGGGTLYFQDTSVGSPTHQTHIIRNICHIPLGFQWNIHYSDQHLISVQPEAGELQANEFAQQKWSFNPKEEKTYVLEPVLIIWPIQNPNYNKSILTLKVMGKGAKGFIQAIKEVLEMGDTMVGRAQSIDVPLVNNSTCSISFSVSIEQTLQDEQLHPDLQPAAIALQLDCEGGTVASHSTFMLRATFRPDRQAHYRWTISYQALSCSGVLLCPPQAVCEVRGKGVFPTMQVSDVCSGGGAAWLSKSYVWELLSVDCLNTQLLSIPSPVEHTYRSPRSHRMGKYPAILIKAMLDVNFSAAPLNSEPSTFALVFYNPGSIPVEWTFLFPDDQQVEFKHWSQREELCHNEFEQMQVVELFSVSPLSGTMLSGQQKAVQFSYSHVVAGTHQLPIILKISHGREILLNFQGVTVEQDRPHLYFLSRHHVFTPIMIGGLTPPMQTYNLYNGGDVPVRYEVDAGVLSQLQENNFNQPLLCCLNPEGVVLPGKTAKLEFIFSPLEAKMYTMDIPIHVRHGETTVVRFDGCGFDTQRDVFPSSETKPAPPVRKIPLPGQSGFLSTDSISLGEIPVCSHSSRVFFLTNVSLKEILYKWCLTQVIRIQPKQGLLRPGESIICVMTFMATDFPMIYHLDIICQLTEQAALAQYSDSLRRWEQEREQQQNEFTITERDLAENRKVLVAQGCAAAAQAKEPPAGKHKVTLPPICSRVARAEQRAQSEAVKVWKRPTAPQPTLLHVEVTARSYQSQEYRRYFPNHFNNRFRCFQTIKPLRPKILSDTLLQEGRPLQTLGPERHFLEHVITSLIRSILDDVAFSQSLLTLASKPLFYKPKVIFSTPSPIPQPLIGLDETNPDLHVRSDSSGTAGGYGTRPKMAPRPEHIPVGVFNDILLNTLQNVMMEAARGDLDLIEHHRVSSPNVSIRSRRYPTAKGKKDDKETPQNKPTHAELSSEHHADTS